MIDKIPPARPDHPGMRGTYGQGDFVQSAQRNHLRRDQHFAAKPASAGELPDPYGAGGFAAGGDGQSGYGADYGQLQPAQRHEKQVSEQQLRKAGTDAKSIR
jgi:hypothetical protein